MLIGPYPQSLYISKRSYCGLTDNVIDRDENLNAYQYNDKPFQEVRFPVLENFLEKANVVLHKRAGIFFIESRICMLETKVKGKETNRRKAGLAVPPRTLIWNQGWQISESIRIHREDTPISEHSSHSSKQCLTWNIKKVICIVK